MTLLSIVQDACNDIGFPVPATVVGNAEAAQYFRLANREGEALSRFQWEILTKEHTFLLTEADQDYALPSDFRYIIDTTQWNRDNQRAIIWINSVQWQFFKSWTTVNGLNLRARIRNNEFEFEQALTSSDTGKTVAFEYVSKNWAQSVGSVAQQKFALDDDSALLDEELMTVGLIWRFKKAKGLEYMADLAEYNLLVKQHKARDGGSPYVRLGGAGREHLGVNTPEGNYPSS